MINWYRRVKGRFLFGLYGEKQKEDNMRQLQKKGGYTLDYIPDFARQRMKGSFKEWWIKHHKEIIGQSIAGHIADIKSLLKDLKKKND